MSVIVIGEQAIGKTTTVVSLITHPTEHVEIINKDAAEDKYLRLPDGRIETGGTTELRQEVLEMKVRLPSRIKEISVSWLDTPGEAFSTPQWRQENPVAWQDIEDKIRARDTQGIILLLPPHRGMVKQNYQNTTNYPRTPDTLPTPNTWITNLKGWLDLFKKNCHRHQHILICLHLADLVCDVKTEGSKWGYHYDRMNPWNEYNRHVKNKYFASAIEPITQFSNLSDKPDPRFFITTIENKSLLELPWIYLASYL